MTEPLTTKTWLIGKMLIDLRRHMDRENVRYRKPLYEIKEEYVACLLCSLIEIEEFVDYQYLANSN